MAVSNERNAVGKVQVHTVPTEPPVINPNGNLLTQLLPFQERLLIQIRRNKLQGRDTLHRRGDGPGCAAHAIYSQSKSAVQHF